MCCRFQLWKDPESIKLYWKSDYVLEEVTTCHKGIYSIILKIQEPLWLFKDHMWWPCGFLLFLTLYVQVLVKSFLFEDWNPLTSIDYSKVQHFYKFWCSCFLSQKQSIEPSFATSLTLFVWDPLPLFLLSWSPILLHQRGSKQTMWGLKDGFQGIMSLLRDIILKQAQRWSTTQKLSPLIGWKVKSLKMWESFSKISYWEDSWRWRETYTLI